jgi:hypothetical protein
VEIAEELLGNKSGLESAVKEATNDGIKKVQKVMAQKMSAMGGLDLPGLEIIFSNQIQKNDRRSFFKLLSIEPALILSH